MNMNSKQLILLAFLLCAGTLQAGVKLPQQIGDNMVLQQQTDACLWGEAKPNADVKIVTSWNGEHHTRTGGDGKWITRIATPAASYNPQTITLSDGDGTVVIDNVLIGEVWFCSGQSNMEMPLSGFDVSPIDNANQVIADAGRYSGIRMVTIERTEMHTPQAYANGQWKTSTPANAPAFSAAAYHFAMQLNRTLDVPVGIIACSWGGSRVEGWLPRELLESLGENLGMLANDNPRLQYMKPLIMYNGLLYPLKDYTIKGFLWYQGCSNVNRHNVYAERQALMVKHWRSLWGLGELPFYYVELAPYNHDRTSEGVNGALLREAQFKAQALIPNSAMITTNDLAKPYETQQVHPANKKDVGERLAFLALNKTYGFAGIAADYPTYERMEIRNDTARVFFRNAPQGFALRTDGYEGFEVAGADRVFHAARAMPAMRGNSVFVTSDRVPRPVAVRYCFRNFQPGTLTGSYGLPAIPFRTDDW
jgi:sialate O-acetylesterase